MNSKIHYHLKELEIAKDPKNPNHVMPTDFSDDDQLILDIGCGIGQTLAAAELGNGAFLIGMDIDFQSISYGKNKFNNIVFINANAHNVPFKDRSFDLVISRVCLPYTNIHKSIREISRVIKYDGKIWLTLYSFSKALGYLASSISKFEIKNTILVCILLINGTLSFFGIRLYWPFVKRYESFQTKYGIKRLLKKNSFQDINIIRNEHFVVTARKREL
jgi:ubiquinone/menaquinone biosynthesis C-methylase UbiE